MAVLVHSETKSCDCVAAWDAAVDTALGLMGQQYRLGAAIVHVCAPAMQLDLMSPVEYRGNADIDTRVIGFYRMLRDIVERQCANNVPYRHPSVEVRDIDGRLLHFLEAIEETPSMTTDTEKAWTLYTVFTASHFVDYFSPFYANGRPENVVYPCKCEPHRCVILSPILSLSLILSLPQFRWGSSAQHRR